MDKYYWSANIPVNINLAQIWFWTSYQEGKGAGWLVGLFFPCDSDFQSPQSLKQIAEESEIGYVVAALETEQETVVHTLKSNTVF